MPVYDSIRPPDFSGIVPAFLQARAQKQQQQQHQQEFAMQQQLQQAQLAEISDKRQQRQMEMQRQQDFQASSAVLQVVGNLQKVAAAGDPNQYGAVLQGTLQQAAPLLQKMAPQQAEAITTRLMRSYQDPKVLDSYAQELRAKITAASDPKRFDQAVREASQLVANKVGDQTLADPQFARQSPLFQQAYDEILFKGPERAAKAGASNITQTVEGNQQLARPVIAQQQEKLIAEKEQLLALQHVNELAKPEQFGLEGKAKSAFWGTVGAINPGWVPKDAVTEQNIRRQMLNEAGQLFNAYRREVTGAAASVQELASLGKTFMNTDMNWNDFVASKDQYMDKLTRSIRLRNRLLSQGLDLQDPQVGARLDEMYYAGQDAKTAEDRVSRARQLKAMGMTKEEATKTLTMEGYLRHSGQ